MIIGGWTDVGNAGVQLELRTRNVGGHRSQNFGPSPGRGRTGPTGQVLGQGPASLVREVMTSKTISMATDRRKGAAEASRSRVRYLIPIAIFVALALMLACGLTNNPRNIPSALIGKPEPQFSLPPLQGRVLGLSTADLVGEVS